MLWTCVPPAVLATSLRLTLQKETIYSSWKSKNHMYELTYLFCCFLLTKSSFPTSYWLEPYSIDILLSCAKLANLLSPEASHADGRLLHCHKPILSSGFRWHYHTACLKTSLLSHLPCLNKVDWLIDCMPPDPPRGSQLRRSYLITPLNKYSCQYEHLSKTLSYGPGARFSKLPVITGPVQLFCFPCQKGVSKLLKIIQ